MRFARRNVWWLVGLVGALLVGVALGATGQPAAKTTTVAGERVTVTTTMDVGESVPARTVTMTVTRTAAAPKPKPKPASVGVLRFAGAGIKTLRPFRTFRGRDLSWTLTGDTSGTGFTLYDESGADSIPVSSSGSETRGSTFLAAGLHSFNVVAPSGRWTITIR